MRIDPPIRLHTRPDAGTLLARALIADAAAAGLNCTVTAWRLHAWASATFTGWRHEGVATLAGGGDADAWLASLPERELMIRGQLLADLSATRRVDNMVELVALTIDRG